MCTKIHYGSISERQENACGVYGCPRETENTIVRSKKLLFIIFLEIKVDQNKSKTDLHYVTGIKPKHWFRNKYPYLKQLIEEVKNKKNCLNWIIYNSRFNLIVPLDDFWKITMVMDKKFLKLNRNILFFYEKIILNKLVCEI